jgi:hypothetical protein
MPTQSPVETGVTDRESPVEHELADRADSVPEPPDASATLGQRQRLSGEQP